jgi:hypothetical protein
MGKGIMGYKVYTEQKSDQFAMVNMHARCTLPLEEQKPPKVIPDFKFNEHAWVFPWGFTKLSSSNAAINKIHTPTRSVIVSRNSGVEIKDL